MSREAAHGILPIAALPTSLWVAGPHAVGMRTWRIAAGHRQLALTVLYQPEEVAA